MRYLFGCGTGRCGTKALAALLNFQPRTSISHEGRGLQYDGRSSYLPPWSAGDPAMVDSLLQQMARRSVAIVGDISFAWLRYMDMIDGTVICLRRGRDATVASWLRRKRDHGTVQGSNKAMPGPMCYDALPKFDAGSREANARKVWETYYEEAEKVQEKHPDRFRIFEMETVLNTEEGQTEILQWAGYTDPVLHVGIGKKKK